MKIGFLTDIHEDIKSLQKAFKLVEQEKADSIICLGDIVGFALPFYKNIDDRDADRCIKLIKENCSYAVLGNHDLFAIRQTPKFTFGFNYGKNWYALDYEKRSKLAKQKIWLYEDSEIPTTLNDHSVEYLRGLNEYEIFQAGNLNIFISHFCFPDFSGSSIFFPEQPFHLKKHFEFIENLDCRISFSGHGHPEGCVITDEEKLSLINFGEYIIKSSRNWLVVPCVANTSRKNGVLVFDTNNFSIKILQLNSI
jgi:predicted phosphodiesterase